MERITSKVTRILVVALLCAAAVTTASSQEKQKVIDVNALAAKGKAIANEDPLAVELRNQQAEGSRRRGFDIGMAAAEGQTLPGPGKDRICASLPAGEPGGCSIAVSFSVERNRNAVSAKRGAAIAKADPVVAAARNVTRDVFYKLGFDIGLAAAEGHTLPGPGKDRIRDSLLLALREGFSAAVSFTLKRNRNDAALGAAESPVVTKDEHFGAGGAAGRARAAFQPENTIKVRVGYRKKFGYKGDTSAFGYVGPTSCDAFSVSVAAGDGSAQQRNPIRISSDSKMEEMGGYYVCSYLVSEIPLDQTIRVSVGLSGLDLSAAWKGGGEAQPPPGQQRTISNATRTETLTASSPRATMSFEMIYAPVAPR